jgi:hypothetical protein
LREEEDVIPDFKEAPLNDEGVNAAAEARRIDERASFIVLLG